MIMFVMEWSNKAIGTEHLMATGFLGLIDKVRKID